MFNRLKKEWNEINDSEKHIKKKSIDSDNIVDNFKELQELSQRINSRFKIKGDIKKFTILTTRTDTYIGGVLFFFMFFGFLYILLNNLNDYTFWIVFLCVATPILYFSFFYPWTKDLEVDTLTKQICYIPNSLIGRHLEIKNIPFQDFVNLSKVNKTLPGSGMKNTYNLIYLNTKTENIFIIDLLYGPIYFINPDIFINSLTRIIKNSA